jgi:two-component sensor histidine kinase
MQATLRPRSFAPAQARRTTAQALQRWGYSHEVTQDVALVVSELVSNAVRHAGSELTLSVHRESDRVLRISVQDATPLPSPTANRPFPAQPGHGLWIVAAVCTAWGVEPATGGKVVWALIAA